MPHERVINGSKRVKSFVASWWLLLRRSLTPLGPEDILGD
jgi:hypothetical protein